jgi:fructuronate reductase
VTRFANPAMGHQLRQIGTDGSLKIPERWLGSLRELRQARREAPILALALAGWAAATRLRADGIQLFGTTDPLAGRLGAAWTASDNQAEIVRQLLANVGAADLSADAWLVEAVARRLPDLDPAVLGRNPNKLEDAL